MLNKIIICLCHPKKIGLFFKDKIYKPILYAIGFFLLYVGIIALVAFSNKVFDSSYTEGSINLIVSEESANTNTNVTFNSTTKTLEGNETKYSNSYFQVYFMPKGTVTTPSANVTTLVFLSDHVECFYGVHRLGEYNYSDLKDVKDFSLSNVVKGVNEDKLELKTIVNAIYQASETSISLYYIFNYAVFGISYYAGLLLFIFFMSFMTNPAIEFKVRTKLCLYDSLIFFVVLSFCMGFAIEWLLYLALCLPVFYSSFTFSHIIKNRR